MTRITSTKRLAGMALKLTEVNFRCLSSPLKVNFAVTYWCQYRCKTCNIWKLKPRDELSTDEILRFIQTNRSLSWVDITGGEIFLRKDIGDLLEAMLTDWKRLALFHFPTNGYQTSKIVKTVERLAPRSAVDLIITVSLDGDESLNDRIRGRKGGYLRQMDTFKALRKIPGVRAFLGMTLSKDNVGQFEATFRSCQAVCPDLEITEFHLNAMQLSGHYYHNAEQADMKPVNDQVREELEKYQKMRGAPATLAERLENTYLKNLDGFMSTGKTPMRCHSLRSSCFIDPWGTVYPCITYSNPVGSLRESNMDLDEIWNSTKARELQQEIWNYKCPQCWTACEAYQSILGNVLKPWNTQT